MWSDARAARDEQGTIEIAERRAPRSPPRSASGPCEQARREIGREIKGSLSDEQREALETITGPGGIAVLVGRAGTGRASCSPPPRGRGSLKATR